MINGEWWKQPLRIIQLNLQVKDTHLISGDKLAGQLSELGANTVVFNVGGIYAWYRTSLEYHYVNPYLPPEGDLLEEVIEAFHRKGIRFVARFDFSKATDYIYQRCPQWFLRNKDGEPQIIGAHRPGEWSLLMSTCINGGYRNEDVAIPVLNEVLERYPVDGVFYNAPHFLPCYCDNCKREYRSLFGHLPDEFSGNPGKNWAEHCITENLGRLYRFVKGKNADIPVILYYNVHNSDMQGGDIRVRSKLADLMCTEPHDKLSSGIRDLPPRWYPLLSLSIGRDVPGKPAPIGIVHTSPGMDWRHTGIAPAEHSFWLSQVPAAGGSLWHTLTGIPDTIEDKRILKTVSDVNQKISRVEGLMAKAVSAAQTAVVWNETAASEGWFEGLFARTIPFDVIVPEQLTEGLNKQYELLIVPEGCAFNTDMEQMLCHYVKEGGHLILEGKLADCCSKLHDLAGIKGETYQSEMLLTSYIRFEQPGLMLKKGMEETELIPHRGRVQYAKASDKSRVLATLVPPFSPIESVGAPPERASLPAPRTEIPLVIQTRYEKGEVIYLPFSLGWLIKEFGLYEHSLMVRNLVHILLGESLSVEIDGYPGLLVTHFKKGNDHLIHLINGAGSRPLQGIIPLEKIKVRIKTDKAPDAVKCLQTGKLLKWKFKNGILSCSTDLKDTWTTLWICIDKQRERI